MRLGGTPRLCATLVALIPRLAMNSRKPLAGDAGCCDRGVVDLRLGFLATVYLWELIWFRCPRWICMR